MTKRELFATTYGWRGCSFELLQSSSRALLLSKRVGGRTAYQVIDYTSSYPSKESELDSLNVFRTTNLHMAEEEYKSRNQTKID